jgi:hypothetical protein
VLSTPEARETPEVKELLDIFSVMSMLGDRKDDQSQEMG